MVDFDTAPLTLNPDEKELIEKLIQGMEELERDRPNTLLYLALAPEERQLIKLVLLAGLAAIESGSAQLQDPENTANGS